MVTVKSYYKPSNLKEALALLSSKELKPIAGGTDLILDLRRGKESNLLDISKLGLDFIKESKDSIEIGTATTHSTLNLNEKIKKHFPLISIACGMLGSWQIRNRGTVGGNIVNAAPCADSVPALLNYDAIVVLVSKKGKRKIKLDKFIIKPYQTQKRPDELVHSIICKKPKVHQGYSFIKLGRRQAVNISRMTLAITLEKDKNNKIKRALVAGGSVSPAPCRMPQIEKALEGKKVSKDLFKKVSNLAADLMVKETGFRWSTPYKKPVLEGLLSRALHEAGGLK